MIELTVLQFVLLGLPVFFMGVLLNVSLIIGICSEITNMRYRKKEERGKEIMNTGGFDISKYNNVSKGVYFDEFFAPRRLTQEELSEIRESFNTYLDGIAAVFYGELDELYRSLSKRNLSDKKEDYLCDRRKECNRFLSMTAFVKDHGIDAYLSYLQNIDDVVPGCNEETKSDATD